MAAEHAEAIGWGLLGFRDFYSEMLIFSYKDSGAISMTGKSLEVCSSVIQG